MNYAVVRIYRNMEPVTRGPELLYAGTDYAKATEAALEAAKPYPVDVNGTNSRCLRYESPQSYDVYLLKE